MSNEHAKKCPLFLYRILFPTSIRTSFKYIFSSWCWRKFHNFREWYTTFFTPAVCLYHCWTPVYKVGVLLTALLSLQAYFFFRLYKAHESYFCCLPFQYKLCNINSFSFVLRKKCNHRRFASSKFWNKSNQKEWERVYKTCLFCSRF